MTKIVMLNGEHYVDEDEGLPEKKTPSICELGGSDQWIAMSVRFSLVGGSNPLAEPDSLNSNFIPLSMTIFVICYVGNSGLAKISKTFTNGDNTTWPLHITS